MKPYCGILSLPHSCTSPTVVVSAGAMSVKELCWQNCKNTRSQGEASTPCKNTRSQGEASTPCKNTRSQGEASTPCKNTRSQGRRVHHVRTLGHRGRRVHHVRTLGHRGRRVHHVCIKGCSITLGVCVSTPPVLRDVGPPGRSISTTAPPQRKLLTILCIAWTFHHAKHMVSVAEGRERERERWEGDKKEGD